MKLNRKSYLGGWTNKLSLSIALFIASIFFSLIQQTSAGAAACTAAQEGKTVTAYTLIRPSTAQAQSDYIDKSTYTLRTTTSNGLNCVSSLVSMVKFTAYPPDGWISENKDWVIPASGVDPVAAKSGTTFKATFKPSSGASKSINVTVGAAPVDPIASLIAGTIVTTESEDIPKNSGTTSCVVDGVGWIVCGVTNFIAKVSDGMYTLIESIVKTEPLNINTADGTNGLYNAWSYIKNIANSIFIVAFLIIIFSQLTSIGVSNYGVKKTLPRLIISAILVNSSYWIAAVAIDASNILGSSIFDELSRIKDNMNISVGAENWNLILGGLLSGSALALSGGAIVAGGLFASTIPGIGMALLYLAIPMVASALLAVFIFVFILIARKAIIVILVLIAPLAFVAMLLPNTEKWFTKWRQTLTSLLVLYPMLSIIYAGAQIAGLSLMSTATGASATLTIITAQLIIVIPFFMLPSLLKKFSGANIDSMASNIAAKGKSLISKGDKAFGISKKGTDGIKSGYDTQKYGNTRSYSGIRGRLQARGQRFGRQLDMGDDKKKAVSGEVARNRKRAFMDKIATDGSYSEAMSLGDPTRARLIQDRYAAELAAEELKEDDLSFQSLSKDWTKGEIVEYAKGNAVTKVDAVSGRSTVHQITESGRRAAIRRSGIIANSTEMQEIAIAAASGSDAIKREAISVMPISKAATSAPWLKDAIPGISSGNLTVADIHSSIQKNFREGKITPDAILNMNAEEIDLMSTAISASTDPQLRALAKSTARKLLQPDPGSPYVGKVISGTATDRALRRF